MELYYVSHPNGGVKKNVDAADKIVKKLSAKYPDDCYVSPIHAIRVPYKETPYEVGLGYCLELLRHCECVVMAGDWRSSVGCMVEYFMAKEWGKKIYDADVLLSDEPGVEEDDEE